MGGERLRDSTGMNDLFGIGDVTNTTREREFHSLVILHIPPYESRTEHICTSNSPLSAGSEIFHAEHDTGKNITIVRSRCDGFTVF